MLSINGLITLVFAGYMAWTTNTLYHVFNPHAALVTHDSDGAALPSYDPLWPQDSPMQLDVYISDTVAGGPQVAKSGWLLWSTGRVLRFGWGEDGKLWRSFNLTAGTVPPALWKRIEANRTVHAHFHLTRLDEERRGVSAELWQSTPLVIFKPYAPRRPTRRLLGHLPLVRRLVRPAPTVLDGTAAAGGDGEMGPDTGVGFWVPTAAVQLVADWTPWPKSTTPGSVLRGLRLDRTTGDYLPVVYAQQLGLTAEKLVRVNRTMSVESAAEATRVAEAAAAAASEGAFCAAEVLNYNSGVLPLEIGVESISVPRWQFRAHMEQTLELQRGMGANDRDIDEMRHLLTENSPLLLGVTMVVSLLHILFDCLAFKNDVSFWNSAETMVGLSVRTVVLDLFSQVVIAAYLYEENASILVLAPAAVGIFIQAWKAQRALGIAARDRNRRGARATKAAGEAEPAEGKGEGGAGAESVGAVVAPPLVDDKYDTQEIDAIAMRYMGAGLAPLVMGFCLWSLLYREYAGWYSWLIGSVTGSVYAFGFIVMTPQLFINYKLKSVAHLPWRFMIYRALNTFIDDLFAFVIRMPAMHRAACFRDDIVFFVYLYQLYIYPVDHKRPTAQKND